MTFRQKYAYLRLGLTYPGLAWKKLRLLMRGLHSPSIPEFPMLLSFFLVSECNLRCAMCAQWRRKVEGFAKTAGSSLSLVKLETLLDEAVPYDPEIYVWGGEPTLYPDFIAFLRQVKKRGLICTVNTNGTMLAEMAQDMVEMRLDSLDVSLDGPESVHDKVRGVPGTHARVMAGLEALKRSGGKKPLVKIIITLSETNIEYVPQLLAEVDENDAIDMSIIQFGWFVASDAGKRYESRMKEEFGVSGDSWLGFKDDQAGRRAMPVSELISKVRQSSYRKPILFFPDLGTKDVALYYTDFYNKFGHSRCSAVERELNIRPDGSVVVCWDYFDLSVGNVNQQTISDIWQGEPLKLFRASLERNGLLPVCSRCCGLYR